MKTLKRNQTDLWYCQYISMNEPGSGSTPVNYLRNEDGDETGEVIINYASAASMRAVISPANGTVQNEPFGELESYDKIIVTDWMDCPINEQTVLFIDKAPAYGEVENPEIVPSQTVLGQDEVVVNKYVVPLYDYVVRRVSKSLNHITIAASRVTTS